MPHRLIVRVVRVLSALCLVAIVLLLVPLGLNYVENASSYGWVRDIQKADDLTDETISCRRAVADVDGVVAGTTRDVDRSVHGTNIEYVVAGGRLQRRGPRAAARGRKRAVREADFGSALEVAVDCA